MNSNIPAITAVSGYVPSYKLTNQELETMVDTNDEWIVTRTGIRERRILKGDGKGTSVLATESVRGLLEKSNTKPEEVDAVICATMTPDMAFPSTATIVCDNLGIKNAFSFDMQAACTGFVYALETASNFIRTGNYKKIVVVGADKMSSIVNYKDRNSCILFGDGAGAVMLEPSENGYGVMDTILKSDGIGKEMLFMKAGGSAYPSTHNTVENGEHYFYQDGKSVYKYAVNNMREVSEEMMNKHHLTSEDLAYFVPHQANIRIIEAIAKRLKFDMDKVTVNIDKYGNTTAATIPLCLWEWEKKFKKGDKILLAAFGGGFTWGSTYLTWAY
ncbi:beta-ketoacyl-ACP synthase III [Aureibacter tunicatorum]|uniref:Beta-ketoacyl-[acyl-carrier-protein] synthase III n=1 Tax=Aureibacter tunicatorum TaxID=866807 RepID=A0AAE3XPA8_9BACT|nr:beta-ketoacyl-ACP synthase III [Aureibacter tunicatorum]MDR6239564.1 3-oxoacyl-[acyl-carrier-protein] synthase-3 [Aureibacter tunicatorum]BDD04041.1 3-oxoacyl-[acyl-carrier-protein] synthase 3 protein 2 [Aureibacter tunicatorum]